MATVSLEQGDLALLDDPVVQELLQSRIPVKLAYQWHDGTPRVVPIWFHWNGEAVVMASPPDAPKLDALRAHPDVALSIDTADWPYKSLMLRGRAEIETVAGVAPEYAAAARRYFGDEQGDAWVAQVSQMGSQMTRIAVRPTWVGLIDFQTRFPRSIAKHLPPS
jgi:hypothetical protein